MNIFALSTLLAIEPQPSDVVVTLTGIALVFVILLLLLVVIAIEGIFFVNAQKKKSEPAAKETSVPLAVEVAPKAPEPVIEDGIPEAVVAAIAAAVASMGGGKYTLRTVARADKAPKGAWHRAGVSDVTSPF